MGGWAFISHSEATICDLVGQQIVGVPVDIEEAEFGGVPGYRLLPHDVDPSDGRADLEFHGGALVMGGGEACRVMSVLAAKRVGAATWAVDYRLPPEDPYPAALNDCVAAYRAVLEHRAPDQIVIGGESAGGNLAAAAVLRPRDEGLPLPAAVVLHTPQLDLTESGDSFQTNRGGQPILGASLMSANLLYAGGHDLADPYVSPLFGDFKRGFPATLLSTGTDLFMSNAVRMHRALRAADVDAELHVLEAARTAVFGSTPEDAELERSSTLREPAMGECVT